MKRILKLAVYGIAAIAALSSCSKNEDVPSQKDIETKIIGKWKIIKHNGDDALTNKRTIWTFNNDGKGTQSLADYKEGDKTFIWDNKEPIQYSIQGNILHSISPDVEHTATIPFINDNQMTMHVTKIISRGVDVKESYVAECSKVTADYSQDIIGMWEGVEMTGDETYGDANHRIEYKADGTYTYYDKVGDSWVPSKNAGNEYNVDGDWLATRWQPTEGADFEYEWWDIVEIKDGTMKWSALREKGDGTRNTTTFTWKKVNLPTQEEIETKIIGRWKKMKHDGKDAVTNKRKIWTFNNDGKGTQSTADYKEGEKTFIWDNKEPIQYSIQGNILHSISTDAEQTATIPFINANQMTMHVTKIKIISRGVDVKYSYVGEYSKVTEDYSQSIIGMWEGVEMTGDETYGDANHRIEYKADGTYVYYNKDGDDWKLSEDVDNEYNVDGDWLASRWRPKAGEDFEYEWWDIVEIKDGTMKWSALREKGDKTRFTTTFTWKKIK